MTPATNRRLIALSALLADLASGPAPRARTAGQVQRVALPLALAVRRRFAALLERGTDRGDAHRACEREFGLTTRTVAYLALGVRGPASYGLTRSIARRRAA